MSAVNGELVSKLDSKTAKTGDSVVIQTKTSVKTSDGTEIPKGSKLMGHIAGVQPSGDGKNAQMALQFDHIELKGGQSMPVHSEIQSIGSSSGETGGATAMGAPPAASSPSSASAPNSASRPGSDPSAGASSASSSPAAAGAPDVAAGTIVAKTGNIAIRTTSVPGVLLANNEPGQQDPRMAQVSSILLGAKKDIQLDGGTQMVLGVSAAGAK
jgi:hypothetical protein